MKQQMKTRRPNIAKTTFLFPIVISTPIHQISAMPPEHHKNCDEVNCILFPLCQYNLHWKDIPTSQMPTTCWTLSLTGPKKNSNCYKTGFKITRIGLHEKWDYLKGLAKFNDIISRFPNIIGGKSLSTEILWTPCTKNHFTKCLLALRFRAKTLIRQVAEAR